MNKKFLSAILFGALMVTSTGTFVSCKDYDDDIKGLQEQIDKLATKEDLQAQITTLQAGLTSAAKDASDAITKATAAETAAKAAGDAAAEAKAAADKAAAEAKAEAIKAVQAEIEALKEEVNASTEAALAEMRKEVAEATQKVEGIIGKIADMVTSVELVYSYNNQSGESYNEVYDEDGNPIGSLWDHEGYKGQWLGFSTAFEKDNVFSDGITNAITFKKDTQVQTKQKFIIRVSPTNAILKPEMISLINSKGEDLSELVAVTSVEKFDGLLTARAARNTGLWEVSCQLKKYDKNSFAAKVLDANGTAIVFAVAVNNTLSTASTREVVSSYDLAMDWSDYAPASKLCYYVNEKNVKDIRNRHDYAEDGTAAGYTELEWSGKPAVEAIKTGSKKNVSDGSTIDNRDRTQGKKLYPVVQGESFTISLINQWYESGSSYKEWMQPSNIRAMYVTLDYEANAVESAPSEWNAWNSYSYTGLNSVIEGTSTQITINKTTAINDIIGFRVYAVNYDGTLVDPDGRAFYVSVGAQVEDTAYNTTWSWKSNASSEISKEAVATGVFDKSWVKAISSSNFIANDTVRYDNSSVDAISSIQYFDADKKPVTLSETTCESIKYVSVATNVNAPAYWYDDNKTYSATIAYKNANGNVLKTITATVTKVLPTVAPADFIAKDKQIVNGVYTCFLNAVTKGSTGNNWTSANAVTTGFMEMGNVFNGLLNANGSLKDGNFKFNFASSQLVGDEEKDIEIVSNSNSGLYKLVIASDYINGTTEHVTDVTYNYGQISSEAVEEGALVDYTIPVTTFKTVYQCILNKSTWAWDGGTAKLKAEVKYETSGHAVNYANIKSTNTYNATDFTKTLDNLKGNGVISIDKAELVSVATSVAGEYFDVTIDETNKKLTFTPNPSTTTNPTANVASKLNITYTDVFGHKKSISIDYTVLPK